MHPAPVNRDVEIADQLVEAPQSRIVLRCEMVFLYAWLFLRPS